MENRKWERDRLKLCPGPSVPVKQAARKSRAARPDAERTALGGTIEMHDKKRSEIPISRQQTKRLRELFKL